MLKAKLSVKFYIVSILLLILVLFGWYGVYFLNANEILMEDNAPMDSGTKMILTVLMSVVLLSWSLSLVTVIRQMVLGYAFYIDESGINTTATANMVLAFIFVVPVKLIPYDAIQKITEENGILSVEIDKSKIKSASALKLFVRGKYHFFSGFTKEKTEKIKEIINLNERKNQ